MSTQRATVYDVLITWRDDHVVEYELHEVASLRSRAR